MGAEELFSSGQFGPFHANSSIKGHFLLSPITHICNPFSSVSPVLIFITNLSKLILFLSAFLLYLFLFFFILVIFKYALCLIKDPDIVGLALIIRIRNLYILCFPLFLFFYKINI